jgi:putative ABC transport system ATP-binding protein
MAAVIDVRQISKHYRRGDEKIAALDGVSFTVAQPSVVAIAGPSGSGKSTLLGMLARFEQPDSGSIHLDGAALDALAEHELDAFRSSKLGFVFQNFNLVGTLTAQENVELALATSSLDMHERRRTATAALAMVGMEMRLGHTPAQLSGGQQQRVAIARALVRRPKLVIADEPTGNLDSKTAQELLELVGRLHRDLGTTFVIATHDQRVMDMAGQVLRLEDGRVAA